MKKNVSSLVQVCGSGQGHEVSEEVGWVTDSHLLSELVSTLVKSEQEHLLEEPAQSGGQAWALSFSIPTFCLFVLIYDQQGMHGSLCCSSYRSPGSVPGGGGDLPPRCLSAYLA